MSPLTLLSLGLCLWGAGCFVRAVGGVYARWAKLRLKRDKWLAWRLDGRKKL
jgi:hypothetical protein